LAERDRVIKDVLALTDMESRRHDPIKALSRGMQQRLGLARVLVNDPELLLLDEPASGLDPRARIELMMILQELRAMGKTIFISSHILSELGDLCDSLTIIDRGKICYTGPITELQTREDAYAYVITLGEEHAPAEDALRQQEGVLDVVREPDRPRYAVTFDPARIEPNDILRIVLDNGGRVVGFQPDTLELKEVFMDLTNPGVA
jgi:ABC-2 type transport system ATP-binding protein